MNVFPTENIDQDSVSPVTVIEGRENPRDNVSRIAYGSYALVYTGTSNTLNSNVPAHRNKCCFGISYEREL